MEVFYHALNWTSSEEGFDDIHDAMEDIFNLLKNSATNPVICLESIQ
jgi:hypothetical protein